MSEPKAEKITLPADLAPCTKSEAYHLARLLITAPETVTTQERQRLLLHFAPSAGRVPQTGADYVAQFVAGPKDGRYFLEYLYSDGQHLYGCDGHTLAWCATDLPAGFYHPRTRDPVEVEAKFPDTRRVIPERQKQKPLNLEQWASTETQGVKEPYLLFRSPEGQEFQRQYLKRAMNGAAPDGVVYQPGQGERTSAMRGSVILKRGDQAQFVIMPVKG